MSKETGRSAGDDDSTAPSPSWESRDELGIGSAFWATVKELYLRPRSIFSASTGPCDAQGALLYGTIAGSLGIFGLLLGGYLFCCWIELSLRRPLAILLNLALDYGFAYLAILTPIIVCSSIYMSALIVHSVLKTRGSNLHFSHTLRVHSYVSGNAILPMVLSALIPSVCIIFALVDYTSHTPSRIPPGVMFSIIGAPELHMLFYDIWESLCDTHSWPAWAYLFSLLVPLLAGGYYLVSTGAAIQSTVHRVRPGLRIRLCYFLVFLFYFSLGASIDFYFTAINGDLKLPPWCRNFF